MNIDFLCLLGRQRDGLASAGKLVLFASEDAHYSIHKMAALLGLGEDNVCQIQTDSTGHMDPMDLELKIQKKISSGAIPFMVVATAGTLIIMFKCLTFFEDFVNFSI